MYSLVPLFALVFIPFVAGAFYIYIMVKSKFAIILFSFIAIGIIPLFMPIIYNIHNKYALPEENSFTPYKVIEMLEDQYDPLLDKYCDRRNNRFSNQYKVRLLQYMGYLTGKIYDLGDSPACGKILGIKDSDYVFQQGSMSLTACWSTLKALFPFYYSNMISNINMNNFLLPKYEIGKEDVPKNRPIINNAYWLNGEYGVGDWETVDSVSESFIGRTGLYLSNPTSYSKENVWLLSILYSVPMYKSTIPCLEVSYASAVCLLQPLLLDDFIINEVKQRGKMRLAINIYYTIALYCSYYLGAFLFQGYLGPVLVEDDNIVINFAANFFRFYGIFEIFEFIPLFIISKGWLTIVGNKETLGKLYRECIFPFHFLAIVYSLIFSELNNYFTIFIFLGIVGYQTYFKWNYFAEGNFFGNLIKIK